MIYLLVILIIIILNFHLKPDKQDNYINNRKVYVGIISVIFFILLVLRHDFVGTDTFVYRDLYENYFLHVRYDKFSVINISSEIGFHLLILLLLKLKLPFACLKIISAAIYIYAVSFVIYKYSKYTWFSYVYFLLFGFFIFNTVMRHSFALSFVLFAFHFAYNRQVSYYIIMILLAVLFHSTAIIIFPIWWIVKLKLNRKTFLFSFIIFFLVLIFSNWIYQVGSNLLGKEYEIQETGGKLTIVLFLVRIFLSWYYLRFMDKYNEVFVYFNICCIILMPLALQNPAFFRILLYYNFFNVLLIPNLIKSANRFIKPMILFMFLSIGIIEFVYKNTSAGIRVIPYVFYWEDYRLLNPNAPYYLF